MSRKLPCMVGCIALIISSAVSVAAASAAETGTKTLPDSSVRPPPTPDWVYDYGPPYECYLPSELCDNEHRVEN